MDTSAESVPQITPGQLAARMGRASAPLILDVRSEEKFLQSRHLLAGARRCKPQDIAAFAAAQPRQEVVVYCVFGHQVSGDVVNALRAAGWDARRLAGGIEGGEDAVDSPEQIATWRAQLLPTMLKRLDWGVPGERPPRWVTRERPEIDRIACPWLIRRFIDRRSEFFYVPAAQVFEEAARLEAVVYDIPGAPVSHQDEWCSFDALLAGFGLKDAALDQLARIVRGADTNRLEQAPESAGLLALSLGLSHLYSDDHAMLAAAMPLYDALYAHCQSRVRAAQAGTPPETHSWQPAALPAVQP